MQTANGRGLVGYKAYILPPQSRFSSSKAWEHYSGPAKWNFQQGLYVYRADRMIQSGGWCRMRTPDEHTKLARVALDFHTDLDFAFSLNVSKARVILPPSLREDLKSHIDGLAKAARKKYDEAAKPSQSKGSGGAQEITPPAGGTSGGNGSNIVPPPSSPSAAKPETPISTQIPAPVHSCSNGKPVGQLIDEAAHRIGETAALKRIKKAVKQDAPEVARGIGW